jgi:DNA gyrase subunit A
MERPDLTDIPEDIVQYIEFLEMSLQQRNTRKSQSDSGVDEEIFEPAELPGTQNVITLTAAGIGKRSPRHLYSRQRRGGMGIFDLEAPEGDSPALLAIVEETDALLLFTNQGRAFRLEVSQLPLVDVRSKGTNLAERLQLRPGEYFVAALPATEGVYVALASERGWVRRVRSSYFTNRMLQGTSFHNVQEGGYLASACWTNGRRRLFMATVGGQGIRFDENQVPNRGCLGMRVSLDDKLVAVCATDDDAGLFLIGADGKGTIRLMEGFRQNKALGAGGKVVMKTHNLIAACDVENGDDLLAITRQGKIIRFAADEVPSKAGVVQGVNCVNLRADEVAAVCRLRKLS